MSSFVWVLAIVFLLPAAAWGADAKSNEISITVYGFAAGKGTTAEDAKAATVKFREALGTIPGYRIIDESNQGVVAVQQLVVGNVSANGSKTTLTIELIDPATTRVLNSFVRVCANCDIEKLLSLVDEAATTLLQKKTVLAGRRNAPVAPPLGPPLSETMAEAGADVLIARDAALQADKAGRRLPEKAAVAWDALESIDTDNPYRGAARQRAAAWREFAKANLEFAAQRDKDYKKLIGVLRLGSVDVEQKKARLSEFRKQYGIATADQALQAAKLSPDIAKQLNTFGAEITSEPAGAKITIDDEPAGVSPWKGMLSSGRHTFRIENEGFVAEEREFIVIPDLANSHAVNLKARDSFYSWYQADVGALMIPFALDGRRVESEYGAGVPDSVALRIRDGMKGDLPVSVGAQIGKDWFGLAFAYVRQRFSRQNFEPYWLNGYGLLVVNEAVVQEKRFYGNANAVKKAGPLTFRGGLQVMAGTHELQAHVLTKNTKTLYSHTSGIVGLGVTGSMTAWKVVAIGAEGGAEYGAGDVIRPDARVWISVGYSPWEYR